MYGGFWCVFVCFFFVFFIIQLYSNTDIEDTDSQVD